jgi:predicted DNA-binding protein
MPAKNPRINIVVEPSLYAAIQDLAEKKGMSLSMLTRDLIKESLETYEDISFFKLAEEREKTFNPDTALSHEKTWE